MEIRERVEETAAPPPALFAPAADVPQERFRPPLFLALSDDDLLGVGVPREWLADVRNASEDSILDIAEHLPEEAVEALLEYVSTGVLRPAAVSLADDDPFAHPDALRRFRMLDGVEELERALSFPWDRWTVFLHPAQRGVVERAYSGAARVSGSAGTGKTVAALHRAVFLARRKDSARVLLTTVSDSLAVALRVKLGCLVGNEPVVAGRISVESLDRVGRDLHAAAFGTPNIVWTPGPCGAGRSTATSPGLAEGLASGESSAKPSGPSSPVSAPDWRRTGRSPWPTFLRASATMSMPRSPRARRRLSIMPSSTRRRTWGQPRFEIYPDEAKETQAVGLWLAELLEDGVAAEEVAVIVRSDRELDRAHAAVEAAGAASCALTEGSPRLGWPSAPCTTPRVWSSVRWPSWPATTRSFLRRSASSPSPMRRTLRSSTTPSGTSFASP